MSKKYFSLLKKASFESHLIGDRYGVSHINIFIYKDNNTYFSNANMLY